MDLSTFENSNLDICLIESDIPEVAKAKPCCMGIDEAGRGPVLGEICDRVCNIAENSLLCHRSLYINGSQNAYD